MNRSAFFSQWLSGYMVMADMGISSGLRFFVDSNNGSDTNPGTSPELAMATLDAAVNLCTASQGDIIYVLPGHAEDLGADSAVDIDVAGVTVIGLGSGADRPTFTATAIAGDFKLAAASVKIQNLLFLGGVDATTGIVEVSAADCAILDCEYRDVTGQATDAVMVTAGSHRLLIDSFKAIMASAAGPNSAIAINASDDVEIRNFSLYGNFAVGGIDFRTGASARAWIHDGKIWTENAADIAIVDTITGSTGTIGPDLELMLKDNAANITTSVTGATFHLFDPVYVCNLAGEKGMLINWTASTHA